MCFIPGAPCCQDWHIATEKQNKLLWCLMDRLTLTELKSYVLLRFAYGTLNLHSFVHTYMLIKIGLTIHWVMVYSEESKVDLSTLKWSSICLRFLCDCCCFIGWEKIGVQGEHIILLKYKGLVNAHPFYSWWTWHPCGLLATPAGCIAGVSRPSPCHLHQPQDQQLWNKIAGPLFLPSSLWCYFSTDPESLVRFILPMNSLLKIHDDLTPLSWLLWTTSSIYTLMLPWQIGVLWRS